MKSKKLLLATTPRQGRSRTTTTVVKVQGRAPRRTNRQQAPAAAATTYMKTLYDPWEHGPIQLGYDTFVTTVLATAYLRRSLIVNADGSFSILMFPQVGFGAGTGMVMSNNAPFASVPTWSNNNASNNTAIAGQMSGARVVSGGIRVMPLVPATAAQGVLFAGALVDHSVTAAAAYSTSTLTAFGSAELGFGARGARSVMLPIDNRSFEFGFEPRSEYPLSQQLDTTVPFISGVNFPPGTVVWYEAILNLEGTPLQGTGSLGLNADAPSPSPGIFESFPSPAHLLNWVRSQQVPASTMDAVEFAAGMYSRSLGSGVKLTRSLFGSGRASRSSLVAGAAESARARDTSVIMEEEQRGGGWVPLRRV